MARRRGVGNVVLGLVLASVLVGGMASPVVADELTPPDVFTDSAPLLPDESADAEIPLGEEPAPVDLSDAPDPAPASEEPVAQESAVDEHDYELEDFDHASAEVLDREEFSETYKAPGGTRVTRFSDVPLNMRVDGKWKPVLTELRGRGPFAWLGRGGAQVQQHPLAPVFAESAHEEPLLTVTQQKTTVSFTLVDALPSQLQRDLAPWAASKERLVYPGVFAGTDLVYEVTPVGVKELLELSERPGADGQSEWQWRVDAGGLSLEVDEETGEVLFTDAKGKVRLVIPKPTMWDSAGASGGPGERAE